MKKQHRKHLISPYLIVTVILLLSANIALGWLMMRQASSAMINLLRTQMLNVSNPAADMLDGDVLERITDADRGTADYERIMQTLTYFQNNIQLRYIYCIRDMGDGTFTFGLDPTVRDPGSFGSPIVFTPALYKASQGVAAVDEKPYEDAWGKFYSAYSPVFNSAGKVAGIVAVDFDAEWYEQQLISLRHTVLVVSVLSLAVGGTIVLIMSERTRRRLKKVYSHLNELADNEEILIEEIGQNSGSGGSASSDFAGLEDNVQDDIDSLGNKIAAMQDKLRAQIGQIREQAYHDGLTGVWNSSSYQNMIYQINAQIEEESAAFSVAVMDLNELKTINDHYGHDLGDKAIRATAGILMDVFGKETVYRIGGDEFAAIVQIASAQDMTSCFDRIDEKLEKLQREKKAYRAALGLSKGYAIFDPQSDPDYASVFRRADQMMYEDKTTYYSHSGTHRRGAARMRGSS